MTLSVRMEGADELKASMQRLVDTAPKAAAQALRVEAELVMAESVRQVPVDTGVLRASATVGEPMIEGNAVTIALGYGGAASAYAVVQHERTDFNHPNGGKAKFLSDPLYEYAQSRLASSLASRLAAWVKGAEG